jgi:HAMP domain-containing protein
MQACAQLSMVDRRSMASKEDEEENYWPGYVDALTTMTMVLTFVMMILALAVFVLSQNVSQAVLENVVREIDAEMPDNPTPVALKQAILDRIGDSETDGTDPSSKSDYKPGQADPQHDSDAIAPTEIAADKIDDVEEPDGKTRISTTPATLTVRYEGNEARLDEKNNRAGPLIPRKLRRYPECDPASGAGLCVGGDGRDHSEQADRLLPGDASAGGAGQQWRPGRPHPDRRG